MNEIKGLSCSLVTRKEDRGRQLLFYGTSSQYPDVTIH